MYKKTLEYVCRWQHANGRKNSTAVHLPTNLTVNDGMCDVSVAPSRVSVAVAVVDLLYTLWRTCKGASILSATIVRCVLLMSMNAKCIWRVWNRLNNVSLCVHSCLGWQNGECYWLFVTKCYAWHKNNSLLETEALAGELHAWEILQNRGEHIFVLFGTTSDDSCMIMEVIFWHFTLPTICYAFPL